MSSSQRIALITGGNRGIGRSAAIHLAKDGVDSVITYRTHAEEAAEVVAEIEALGRRAAALQLDIGDSSTFGDFAGALATTLRANWGDRDTFDFLVNNAGNSSDSAFDEVTEEEFDRLVDIHFKGVFFLTQRLLDQLADGGAIVNLSSGLARFSYPKRVAYGSVKGAVEVLSRYLAAELGPRGIRVNVVAPGAVATDFSGGVVRDTSAMQEAIASNTALGRHAVADDIGPVIASILRDDNHWVTGQRIEASGGVHL
jgi:NAD(P)-dependent dehydrogenase (short-subunit alcohol dehydrogenase family)